MKIVAYGVIIFLLISSFSLRAQTWPLGLYKNRSWTSVEVPGTLCGDSTPYQFVYSPPVTEAGEYRLIVYFQGGGTTLLLGDGSLKTHLQSLETTTQSLRAEIPDGNDLIFMDRPENDAFIGDGHWVVFPYCTQDHHIGRLSEATVYDFTNTTESDIKLEVQTLINEGHKKNINVDTVIRKIELDFPAVNVKSYSYSASLDKYMVTSVEVKIFHHGGLNTEAAVQKLFSMIESDIPDFKQHAKVLISGGSAGGYGAWYNTRLFGDLIYGNADANLTLIPMAGTPTEKYWSDDVGDLIADQEQVDEIDHRFSIYGALRPCEVTGGAHTSGNINCDDGIDLLNHYSQRYPAMDIKYAPFVNKQDYVVAGALRKLYPNDVQLENILMRFCKTTHAYMVYFSKIQNTHPYSIWSYLNDSSSIFYSFYDLPLKPEHTPKKSVLLQKIQNPNGESTPTNYNLLGFMNALASRTYDSNDPLHIEFTPIIVADENDPNTSVSVFSNVFDGNYDSCNCPSKLIPTTGIANRYSSAEKLRIININHSENTSTISFFLSEEMFIRLCQIDINGKELVLEHKKFLTGINTVSYNSEHHAQGIYIYKFITPSAVITQKSSFIK